MSSGAGRDKNFPNASIIVACYNGEKTIGRVLKAMLSLDYPAEYEIIVVDDASTDGSKKIIEGFAANPKVRATFFEENRGVCRARNEAISMARFEIVVNMDHDCIPEKESLSD